MKNLLKLSTNPNRIRKVVDIELLIAREGMCNFMGMVLEALESKEQELIADIEGFNGSQYHKNLEYQMKVVEFAMSAVDIDTRNSNLEACKASVDRLYDNLKSIGVLA